jgi:CheY-specific phosphatase CheX
MASFIELEQKLEKSGAIEIISMAIAETITNYSKIQTQSGRPFVTPKTDSTDICFAALLSLQSGDLSVDLMLGFSKALFLDIYNNTTQSDLTDLTQDEMELAGELLNVSFGIIDEKLSNKGLHFKSGFPKIVLGDELSKILNNLPAQSLSIPLESAGKKYNLLMFQMSHFLS